jgi:two-component system nitrogen regulation response regulator NtrX
MNKAKRSLILLADDDVKLLANLSDILGKSGYAVLTAERNDRILDLLAENPVDALILDLVMPPHDGMSGLKNVRETFPALPVIILSGHGTIANAVEAIKAGAFDFLEKPIEWERILITLENALQRSRLERERDAFLKESLERYQMIGAAPAIKQIFVLIEKVAAADSRVLIHGESGTGKELIAKAIHLRGERAAGPFVTVNCAAIPDELIESELFGHERGAFTGAVSQHQGKFALASGGTLFLDEIGEMSPRIQAKVLRVIEDGEICPVGSSRTSHVDVRIIAATNRDLKEALRSREFREDLYFRLGVIQVSVPPLRERREDIPLLVEHFMAKLCAERKRPTLKLSVGALETLIEYPWPGNVRELRNLVEKMVVLSGNDTVLKEEIEFYLADNRFRADDRGAASSPTLPQARKDLEKETIQAKLTATHWNYERSAAELGISRATLFRKIKELRIERDQY